MSQVTDPYTPLEMAAALNLPTVQLTLDQVYAILERRNDLIENNNRLVRQNWELLHRDATQAAKQARPG